MIAGRHSIRWRQDLDGVSGWRCIHSCRRRRQNSIFVRSTGL